MAKNSGVEAIIMQVLRIDPAEAARAADAVRTAAPTIAASDFEIGLLWERMSRPYIIGWIEPDEPGVALFLAQYGAKFAALSAAA